MYFVFVLVLAGGFGAAAAVVHERGHRRLAIALIFMSLLSLALPFLILAGPS